MVSHLCKSAGVSRSGYYTYYSKRAIEQRKLKEKMDEALRDIILKAFRFKNRKKGARQIKMTLAGQFNIVYNLKRIRRIMGKYNIICPFRKANPYKRMMKATQEHRVLPNLLNREFKQDIPYKYCLQTSPIFFTGIDKRHIYQRLKMPLLMRFWLIMSQTALPWISLLIP